MTRNELEISINQYLDGTLPDGQRASLEARLNSDPEARSLLEEDRALTEALRSLPLPEVRWDQFARTISSMIDEQAQERASKASWVLRLRAPGFLAMAASVLLAAGIAIHFFTGPGPTPAPSPLAPAPTALLVEGPDADQSPAAPVTEVSIGPGGSYAKAPSIAPYADEIDTRPSRVVIAASYSPQDAAPAFPF